MTGSTNMQQTTQDNFPNTVRAVALNKWAIATSASLGLKVSLVNRKIESNAMIRVTYGYMWGAYIRSEKNEPIHKMIDEVKKLTEKDIKSRFAAFLTLEGKDVEFPLARLREAQLEDKRIYLRAVPVISAPIAAAYLGVTAAAINKFTADHCNSIGDRYARGYCLSMDEVFLIERNPQWLAGAVSKNDGGTVKAVNDKMFDRLLHVGEDVACTFTDMTPSDLRKAVKPGAQTMRPYRLSDLEEIRVAKLNATV